MATHNRVQRRTTSTTTRGRFGAPSSAGRASGTSRHRRSAGGTARTLDLSRRRSAKSSGKGGALQGLTGLLAGKQAAKAGGKGAKAGAGVAMLTAAAGLAFKNRDKLTSMLKRDGGGSAGDLNAAGPPQGTTGSAVHPGTSSPLDATGPAPGAGTSPRTGEDPSLNQ